MSPNTDVTVISITAQPTTIAGGGIVLLTAEIGPFDYDAVYDTTWEVRGPQELSARDTRIALLGATTVTGGRVPVPDEAATVLQATLDTSPLSVGIWEVRLHMERVVDEEIGAAVAGVPSNDNPPPDTIEGSTGEIQVTPKPFAAGDDVGVTLKRTAVPPTADQALWVAIRNSTNAIGFENYSRFIETVICGEPDFDGDNRLGGKRVRHKLRSVKRRTGLPFPNVDRFRLLKAATEVFLMVHCGVDLDDFSNVDLDEESARLNRTVDRADLEAQMRDYLVRVAAGEDEFLDILPYLGLIRRQLGDVAIVGVGEDDDEVTEICSGLLAEKLEHPCFLELIDSYWRHEGGLLPGMHAVMWRFQNRMPRGRRHDPLAGLDIDPLRPINNLLWGLVQDQQHRLTTVRLAYEYDHEYGVRLSARPGPPVRGADSRSRFMQAFHNLMAVAAVFMKEDDDTTHIADGFPVLNALKETHLLLTEGAHNQYGDLPSTARHEFLMYEWILSRREMSDFLPTRKMVAYAEAWMAPLEALNKLLGGPDASVMHFRDLAVFGEQLLLSIRFGAWSRENNQAQAANWVRYWRPEIQGYIHAYRAVAGVDLTRPAYGIRPQARAGAYR
jgi:hypothetical protein